MLGGVHGTDSRLGCAPPPTRWEGLRCGPHLASAGSEALPSPRIPEGSAPLQHIVNLGVSLVALSDPPSMVSQDAAAVIALAKDALTRVCANTHTHTHTYANMSSIKIPVLQTCFKIAQRTWKIAVL